MLIDGGGDENVETSSLEASNLIVLRVSTLFVTYGFVFLELTHDMLFYFPLAGIITYPFKCQPGSSWARFIKFVRARRLH